MIQKQHHGLSSTTCYKPCIFKRTGLLWSWYQLENLAHPPLVQIPYMLHGRYLYFYNSWLLRMKASRVTQLVDDYYAMGVVSCIKLFIPKTCRKLASFWVTSFLTHSDVTALVACLYRLGILPKRPDLIKYTPVCSLSREIHTLHWCPISTSKCNLIQIIQMFYCSL